MIKCAWKATNRRRSGHPRLPLTAGTVLPVSLAVALLLGGSGAYAAGAHARARAARVLRVRDEGRLRFISSSGSQLIDEGAASGTLVGKVRLHFTYDGSPTVSAQFTISGNGWSIRAQGKGSLSNPTSVTPSLRGSLTITGGSGRYAHARGSGELFGVFNRRSYGLTVQAIGKLTY